GAIVGSIARKRVDPRRGKAVLFGAGRARDLAVSDVADQEMPERVLGLARDRSTPLAPDEFLSGQATKSVLDLRFGDTADRRECARPEHLAEHGGVLQQRLLLGGQRVQTSRDD